MYCYIAVELKDFPGLLMCYNIISCSNIKSSTECLVVTLHYRIEGLHHRSLLG